MGAAQLQQLLGSTPCSTHCGLLSLHWSQVEEHLAKGDIVLPLAALSDALSDLSLSFFSHLIDVNPVYVLFHKHMR